MILKNVKTIGKNDKLKKNKKLFCKNDFFEKLKENVLENDRFDKKLSDLSLVILTTYFLG